jgi:hypothetical protein
VEDETVKKEDCKVLNQAVTFTGFVNCDDNIVTIALLSVEDICDAASKDRDVRENCDEELDDPFGDAVSEFQMMQLYVTSLPIDNVSMQRLTQLERELLFH